MAPPAPPISIGLQVILKLNPGEISVKKIVHYDHLEYLALGNGKKNITDTYVYDSLEI